MANNKSGGSPFGKTLNTSLVPVLGFTDNTNPQISISAPKTTMTLLMSEPNRTLKGHKLLILSPMPASQHLIDQIKALFPDLEIAYHQLAWGVRDTSSVVPSGEWKDVTILLTGSGLPEKEQAPKLQYVQLFSAGANHILDHPLFKETDIVFCTANGVHG